MSQSPGRHTDSNSNTDENSGVDGSDENKDVDSTPDNEHNVKQTNDTAEEVEDDSNSSDGSGSGSGSGNGPQSKKQRLIQERGSTIKKGSKGFISIRSDCVAPNKDVRKRYFDEAQSVSFIHDEEPGDEGELWIIPLEKPPEEDDEYKVADDPETPFTFSSRPLLEKIGMTKIVKPRRYDYEWDEEFEAICIDLDQNYETVDSS
jgi:hypothetical protein